MNTDKKLLFDAARFRENCFCAGFICGDSQPAGVGINCVVRVFSVLRQNGASSQQSGADLNSQLSTMNHQLSAGRKLGIDATKKLPGEGFKRSWPPIIRMDAAVKAKVEKFFNP